MDPILTTILAALVAGAAAKAKDMASKGVSDAYDGLKALLIRKLGRGGVVQSVEDEPESEQATSRLVPKRSPNTGSQLMRNWRCAPNSLKQVLAAAKTAAGLSPSDIEIEESPGPNQCDRRQASCFRTNQAWAGHRRDR